MAGFETGGRGHRAKPRKWPLGAGKEARKLEPPEDIALPTPF